MGLPPRLGVVLSVLQLLLLTACSADDRPPSDAQLTAAAADSTPLQRSPLVRDCSDLADNSSSGVYLIMEDLLTPTSAYCDMSDAEGEGWTVFQRRADFTPRQDFFLDWESYKWGFGRLDQEFWWGLHHLWQLTSQLDRIYELRVDLWDWEGQTRYATYQHVTIASEADGYRLDLTDYLGTAGDGLEIHNGMKFTTKDHDNDEWDHNCASMYEGAWWYCGSNGDDDCFLSNLNGRYEPGTSSWQVVSWGPWRSEYSLQKATMKIRPTEKL